MTLNEAKYTIAILAGVVNFLPHPNFPRTRDPGVRNSQMMRGLLYIAVLKKVRYALCPMPTEAYALCRIVPHMRARKAISLGHYRHLSQLSKVISAAP